jgi:hypothetical protein
MSTRESENRTTQLCRLDCTINTVGPLCWRTKTGKNKNYCVSRTCEPTKHDSTLGRWGDKEIKPRHTTLRRPDHRHADLSSWYRCNTIHHPIKEKYQNRSTRKLLPHGRHGGNTTRGGLATPSLMDVRFIA